MIEDVFPAKEKRDKMSLIVVLLFFFIKVMAMIIIKAILSTPWTVITII